MRSQSLWYTRKRKKKRNVCDTLINNLDLYRCGKYRIRLALVCKRVQKTRKYMLPRFLRFITLGIRHPKKALGGLWRFNILLQKIWQVLFLNLLFLFLCPLILFHLKQQFSCSLLPFHHRLLYSPHP